MIALVAASAIYLTGLQAVINAPINRSVAAWGIGAVVLFLLGITAAVILGKSPSMVTYLCRNGSLQAKKIGGMWQIYREDLERIQRGE